MFCINIYEGDESSYGANSPRFIGFSDTNAAKEVTTIYVNHEFAPACLHRNFKSNSVLLQLRGIDGTVTAQDSVFYALNQHQKLDPVSPLPQALVYPSVVCEVAPGSRG